MGFITASLVITAIKMESNFTAAQMDLIISWFTLMNYVVETGWIITTKLAASFEEQENNLSGLNLIEKQKLALAAAVALLRRAKFVLVFRHLLMV